MNLINKTFMKKELLFIPNLLLVVPTLGQRKNENTVFSSFLPVKMRIYVKLDFFNMVNLEKHKENQLHLKLTRCTTN